MLSREEGSIMAGKDIIMMSSEEARRINIINQAIEKLITQKKAAEVIGLSYRQTKRLVGKPDNQ